MGTQQVNGWIEKYERMVYSICYKLTQNHHTAQDLAQDTFVSAYLHAKDCPQDNEKAWLARIAVNKAKDHLKSAYKRRVALPGEDTLCKVEMPKEQQQLQTNIESNESKQTICAAIDSLREPYRRVAVLHLLEDISIKEVAEVLGRPRKTVQTQVYRAKMQLRGMLSQLYEERGAAS